MKPVRADDVRPETRLWQSPKHLLVTVGFVIAVGIAMFLATRALHVPVWAAITLGLVITLAFAAVDIVRRRRSRRAPRKRTPSP